MNGMSGIIKTATRFTVVPMLVFGIYLLMRGHVSHGAGFGGGVIIALSLLQLMLSFGAPQRRYDYLSAGAGAALVFLALGTSAMAFGRPFLASLLPPGRPFALLSGGFIALYNIALCAVAAASLMIVVTAMARFRKGK